MKLIRKVLNNKNMLGRCILVSIVLITAIVLQTDTVITLKNKSIIDKIEDVNGYHTLQYQNILARTEIFNGREFQINPEINSQSFAEYTTDYINGINKSNNIDLVESVSYVYSSYFNISLQEKFEIKLEQIQNIQGYTNENGINQFNVIEGKKLDELKEYELAIPISYVTRLQEQGINYKDLFIYDYNGQSYSFVSVYESPYDVKSVDTGLVVDHNNTKVDLFNMENNYILANNEQLKKLFDSNLNENYVGFDRITFLVRLKDYSVYNESLFSTLLTFNQNFLLTNSNHYTGNMYQNMIKLEPLYYTFQSHSVSHSVFEYLIYTLLAVLLIIDLFIFYSFAKRKLEYNKEKIGIMLVSGISKFSIMIAFVIEYIQLFFIAVVLLVGFNLFATNVLNMQYFSALMNVYDFNLIIFVETIKSLMLILIIICIITVIQIYIFTKKDLILLIKEKDLVIHKKSKIKMNYKFLPLTYSIRNLLSNRYKLIRMIIAYSFVFLSLFLVYSTMKTTQNIYNENTLGIKFDYIIDPINDDQFRKINTDFSTDFSAIDIIYNGAVIDRVEPLKFFDVYRFYNVDYIMFYSDSQNFLPSLSNGLYAQPNKFCYDSRCVYKPNQVNVSTLIDKIKKDDLGDIIDNKYVELDRRPYLKFVTTDTLEIKGVHDSLINDGYIVFVPTFNDQYYMGDQSVHPSSRLSSLINVEQDKKIEFEQYLLDEQINYISYDDYLLNLNSNNVKVNKSLFTSLVFIFIVLFILLVNMFITNKMENTDKQDKNNKMIQMGYSIKFIKRVQIIDTLLVFIISIITAVIMFLFVKVFYFNNLRDILGLHNINVYGENIVIYAIIIVILLITSTYFMSKKTNIKIK